MPVVVACAHGALGRAILDALLVAVPGIELRATVCAGVERTWFKARRIPVAVTDLDDVELFTAVLVGAHTLVLLGGELDFGRVLPTVVEAIDDSVLARVIAVGTDASVFTPLAVFEGLEVVFVAESVDLDAVVTAVLAADARR